MKTAMVALCALLGLGSLASAQEAPASGWAPNEVVEAVQQAPGPAFWHVKKGDSEIYILGTIEEMPKGQSFNTKHLGEVIDGSRAVLTAPIATAGIFTAGWFLLTHRGLLSMPDDKKLEDTLPPDLKARFVAMRSELKIPAKEFEDDPPILVAMKLQERFSAANNLDGQEPMRSVEAIAKQKHVPMHPIAEYSALDLVKQMLRLPLESQQVCLEEALTKLDNRKAHAAPLAEAWAEGNLKGIKANYSERGFAKCIKQASSFQQFADRATQDYMKAIDEALSKPGKTVMVTDLGDLLRNTGVAEQLHAKGITIEGPAE